VSCRGIPKGNGREVRENVGRPMIIIVYHSPAREQNSLRPPLGGRRAVRENVSTRPEESGLANGAHHNLFVKSEKRVSRKNRGEKNERIPPERISRTVKRREMKTT